MAEHRSFPCSFCLVENKSAATWVVQFKSSSRGKKDAEHGEQGLRAKKVGRGRKILSELEDDRHAQPTVPTNVPRSNGVNGPTDFELNYLYTLGFERRSFPIQSNAPAINILSFVDAQDQAYFWRGGAVSKSFSTSTLFHFIGEKQTNEMAFRADNA